MNKTPGKILALIVDDSAMEAEIIRRSVAKGGYEVAIAHNGFDGLEFMLTRKPAIVLSDVNMPGMNGFEMCAAMREKKEFRDIPVILISVLSDPEDVIMAITAGADGYITKPYDEDTLLSRIEALVSVPGGGRAAVEETMEIEYKGKVFTIPINYHQQMNILISVYENLVSQNHQLANIQAQLAMLNERLEEKVRERTAALTKEIEERIKTAESLVESERKYRTLFTNMRNGFAYCKIIFDKDEKPADWIYLEINDAFERVTGLKKEAVVGKKATEIFPSIRNFKPDLFEIYGRVALTGEGTEFTINFDILNIWLSISVYSPEKGYFVAVFDDVTDLKKTENALIESEARHRAIMETANDAIICVDPAGKVYMWNPKAEEMFGYHAQEVFGRNILDLIMPESVLEQTRLGFTKFLDAGAGPLINKTTESSALHKDGLEIPIELSIAPVKMKDGWGASAIIRDITERKKWERRLIETNQKLQHALDEVNRTQKMLIRSEKLAALGQLAAGVAHELKNPLNIIYTSTQLMVMEDGLSDEVKASGKTISEQVLRAVKIIDNLRDFARERKPETRRIDLHPFIEKTMSLVTYEMKGEGIDIALEFCPDTIWIMGDEDQLAQVFLNITNNARDSMNMKRKSYSFDEAERLGWRARLAVRTLVDDVRVKIIFEDNGLGISEENKRKIFTPFFTTKGETTGTGLGIAIALSIIENHGGTIEFESEEGKGAAFTVKLPLAN